MTGLTLDEGALIGLERANDDVRDYIRRALDQGERVRIPAGVLAQVWRADPRQHALHVLLALDQVSVVALDRSTALRVGALCARRGTHDVVDASVVDTAREYGDVVVTSDPDDLRALDPELLVFAV